MAAMKNVLSPNSETIIIENPPIKACVKRAAYIFPKADELAQEEEGKK